MSEFDAIIDAQLSGETLAMALLFEAQFTSESFRLWTGVGTRIFGGQEWLGIGGIASISEVTRLQNGEMDPFEITLAASEEIIQTALIEFETEARGRSVIVSMQFLNAHDELALGEPWRLRDGIMRGANLTVTPDTMELQIICDTLMSRRNKPAYGRLTDRDQKARYPSDRGLEFVHTLNGSEVTWPDF
jgi:hypothetical protein